MFLIISVTSVTNIPESVDIYRIKGVTDSVTDLLPSYGDYFHAGKYGFTFRKTFCNP